MNRLDRPRSVCGGCDPVGPSFEPCRLCVPNTRVGARGRSARLTAQNTTRGFGQTSLQVQLGFGTSQPQVVRLNTADLIECWERKPDHRAGFWTTARGDASSASTVAAEACNSANTPSGGTVRPAAMSAALSATTARTSASVAAVRDHRRCPGSGDDYSDRTTATQTLTPRMDPA